MVVDVTRYPWCGLSKEHVLHRVDSMKNARNTVKEGMVDSRLDPVKTPVLQDHSEALYQERHENHGPCVTFVNQVKAPSSLRDWNTVTAYV